MQRTAPKLDSMVGAQETLSTGARVEPTVKEFEAMRSVDPSLLSHAEIHRLANNLRNSEVVAETRVAFAGNVVLGPLASYPLVQLARGGIRADWAVITADDVSKSRQYRTPRRGRRFARISPICRTIYWVNIEVEDTDRGG
jgi:hypothetical protein